MLRASELSAEVLVNVEELFASRYRIIAPLGSGAMGAVFRAMDTRLNRVVALKCMNSSLLAHPQLVERFRAEAQRAARLKCEHIPDVLDLMVEDSRTLPYFAMEFCDGEPLDAILKRGALSASVACEYALHVCMALAVAHRAGIVHRDLKPANLLLTTRLDSTPCIKVLDWGISKESNYGEGGTLAFGLTRHDDTMGTPHYMSPEQFTSTFSVDHRADIYSLGVVLFEMTTGARPFKGATFDEVKRDVLCTIPPDPARLASLPRDLAAAIGRCLEKQPGSRFGDVGELAAVLEPFAPVRAASTASRIAAILGRGNAATASESATLAMSAQERAASESASGRSGRDAAAPGSSMTSMPVRTTVIAATVPTSPQAPRRRGTLFLAVVAALCALLIGWLVLRSQGVDSEESGHLSPAAMTVTGAHTPPTSPPAVATATSSAALSSSTPEQPTATATAPLGPSIVGGSAPGPTPRVPAATVPSKAQPVATAQATPMATVAPIPTRTVTPPATATTTTGEHW